MAMGLFRRKCLSMTMKVLLKLLYEMTNPSCHSSGEPTGKEEEDTARLLPRPCFSGAHGSRHSAGMTGPQRTEAQSANNHHRVSRASGQPQCFTDSFKKSRDQRPSCYKVKLMEFPIHSSPKQVRCISLLISHANHRHLPATV